MSVEELADDVVLSKDGHGAVVRRLVHLPPASNTCNMHSANRHVRHTAESTQPIHKLSCARLHLLCYSMSPATASPALWHPLLQAGAHHGADVLRTVRCGCVGQLKMLLCRGCDGGKRTPCVVRGDAAVQRGRVRDLAAVLIIPIEVLGQGLVRSGRIEGNGRCVDHYSDNMRNAPPQRVPCKHPLPVS